MSKSFTVEGLSAYVTKLDQVNDTALASMKKEAEDYIQALSARNYADTETMNGFTYVGSYLEVAKPNAGAWHNNWLDLVYEISYSNSYGGSFKYYYGIGFSDLVLQADNSIDVDLSDYSTTSHTFNFTSGDHGYYLYGYQTQKDLFDDWIKSSMDTYTYETDIA